MIIIYPHSCQPAMSVLIVIVRGTIKYTLISDDVVPFGGATTLTAWLVRRVRLRDTVRLNYSTNVMTSCF